MRSRDEAGATRWAAITIGGLAVLVVLLLIGNLIVRPGGSASGPATQPYTVSAGPEAGTSVPTYVAARRAALAQVAVPEWAVVSFTAYQTVTAARAQAAGAAIGALLVATPGGFPSTIEPSDSSVSAWAASTRKQAATDAAGLRSMLPTAGDPQTAADFRADLDRLAVVAKVDPSAPIVFGILVNASPAGLQAIAGAAGSRLVDAVGVKLPDLAGVAGLRPEETDQARSPNTRTTG